ncbi:hypothetical protein [Nocardioides marmoribigeumensis]|jgi:hypothetical protein|uniref:Uncharacterized protein n=1 Tax=Nocardioides marmoribigeumensis TaxID=433649 RepID=A0ABU2BX99_9ACTN|nr:hypothetical protein [Nocardioides marmoribigeumensis]MDR7363033.1 hypothetical protein [Nocardioides marmoribigeumensis]
MTNSTLLRFSAAGLLVGALVLSLGDLLRRTVDSATGSSPTAIAASAHDHAGVWLTAGVLSALAPVLLIPGVCALVATTRGRGSRVVAVGGALVVVGLVASAGHAVAYYAPFALYGRAATDAATIQALDDASEAYPMLVGLIVAFVVGLTIGMITLLVGLRRARRVPVWAPIAAVVFAAAGSSSSVAMGVLGIVAALAAFLPAARSLTAPTVRTVNA